MSDVFDQYFGHPSEIAAAAPGRVNLIGEHTDYNGGFVLPLALPHQTHVFLARRDDCMVRAVSRDVHATPTIAEYQLGGEQPCRQWWDYVQGVTKVLAADRSDLRGVDLLIDSEVPIGKGLASSASLEVAVARALSTAWDLALDDITIAWVAHQAETQFVGAPVGIMDQMAASLGHQTAALLIDTERLVFERVSLPADAGLVVLDSGLSHHHASGEYRARRRECDEAASALGVTRLRELSRADLSDIDRLPDPLNRRARHVVTENERVLLAVEAFRQNDLEAAGQLFSESHISMRDDFQVSLPPIDELVAIANRQRDVYGARLTGGGFGGSIVALCRRAEAEAVARQIAGQYRTASGIHADIHLPRLRYVS